MFITFEGINGSGKSTQAKLLFEYLKSQNKDVVLTKEPGGGGEFCMKLRTLLVQTTDMSKMAELFLLYASRVEHIRKVIKPALEAGKIVICDRYIDSSFAYQCCDNPEREELVKYLHKSIGNLMPDLTFLIDIPVSVSESRLAPLVYEAMVQGEGSKKYDELATNHMQKILNVYHKLAEENKNRIKVIDGTKDVNDVFEEIKKYFKNIGNYQ